MTKELQFYFQSATDALIAGGLTYSDALNLLTNVIQESSQCIDVIDDYSEMSDTHISLSEKEHDLCMEIIHYTTKGGLEYNHAILLVAMLMAAIEERLYCFY